MDASRIRELLALFSAEPELSDAQISQISAYLDLLVKWNARMNLTAIRDPEEIIRRHFGESLFAAQLILRNFGAEHSLADIGSGAGFPGLPMKVALPQLRLTLIEAQQKKATFLKEVVRTLDLPDVQVLNGRAEDLDVTADVVTLRAVESFEIILPAAAELVGTGGNLLLLIGAGQVERAEALLQSFQWLEPKPIPESSNRVVLLGRQR